MNFKNISTLIRVSREYAEWRRKVRRPGKCAVCGATETLEAHHIEHMADLIKRHKITSAQKAIRCTPLWDTNNGVCLCHYCHTMVHTDEIAEQKLKRKLNK